MARWTGSTFRGAPTAGFRRAVVVAGVATAVAGACVYLTASTAKAVRVLPFQSAALGPIQVAAPGDDANVFIILLSDGRGITPELRASADSMVAKGAAVIMLSTPELLRSLERKPQTTCHYVLGAFEQISQSAQKALDAPDYLWPVIVGEGMGGTVAYLAQAQAPDNTIAGAVSIGFETTIPSKVPFCGVTPAKSSKGAYSYQPSSAVARRWVLYPDQRRTTSMLTAAGANATMRSYPDPTGDRFAGAIGDAFAFGARAAREALADMPTEELPVSNAKTLVVFYSGDGGWRDIDKQISEYLAEKGVAVVGVDSLRYFWREKTPREIGRDLDHLISQYRQRWGVSRVALVGYSMGAGILPFAWHNLPTSTQQSVDLIALLSLDVNASFSISVAGYLGLTTATDVPIGSMVRALPHEHVVCFYGAEESSSDESGCLAPEMQGAMLVERPGGHHFDGNYQPIAEAILRRLKPPTTGS